jgi:predicted peptidase
MEAVIICVALCLAMAAMAACSTETGRSEVAPNNGIVSVAAITEVFGTGQEVTAVAIDYGIPIDSSTLSLDAYSVTDRTISQIYTNTKPETTKNSTSGNYVILELATPDTVSFDNVGQDIPGNPQSGAGQRPENLPEESEAPGFAPLPGVDSDSQGGSGNVGSGSPTLGSSGDEGELSNNLAVTVTQGKEISAANGAIFAVTESPIESTEVINLVVDDFEQLVFTDPAYDERELMYNLYVPADYDAAKSYPLVLFIEDAGGVGTDPVKTLTQGLGAVIWATPEEQAKHECFVLAPQYTEVMANDYSETTVDMDVTVDLIENLSARYSIDMDRIYNTGQSMGCMTSIAMDIKYPDLFAASFLVAGQWDANLVDPLADKPLWIVVCEGDTKAKPGMDAITAELADNGATVSKATWDSTADSEEFDTYVMDMLAEGSSVNYSVFEGGSHTYTWQVAYTIEGIRDWLFEQTRL